MAAQDDDNRRTKTLFNNFNRLCEAIRNNNIRQVRICIEHGVDLTCSSMRSYDDDYVYALVCACRLGYEEIIEELLKAGADPNQLGRGHRLPAMLMAAYARVLTLSMTRSLISYGADVNLRDAAGKTILHYLTIYKFNDTDDNFLSAVKLLLDNGANLYARNDWFTPLYMACYSGKVDLVKLFIAEGADVNFDNGHEKMLRAAAESCNIEMFDLLLDAGANRQLTPDALMKPCYQNNLAMIARILDTCEVDINMSLNKISPGRTILHYACYNREVTSAMVQLLLDHGSDVKAVSVTGDTALHYAVEYCDCHSKIRQILSYNPPLNIKNNANQTPLFKFKQSLRPSLIPLGSSASWYLDRLLAFKMIITASAKASADFKHELNQLLIKDPEIQKKSDYEINSTISLKEMCRFVICRTIPVPLDASLRTLPIPKLLREYLNFPEFDPLIDEYLKTSHLIVTDNMFAS